uniref:PHR domain-containing protein n=1 Tax=Romanomermis culicivorax TaxID=13658 RepID=A0A915JEN3_ROMCU
MTNKNRKVIALNRFVESGDNPDPLGSVLQDPDPDPLNQVFQDPDTLSPKKSIRPIPTVFVSGILTDREVVNLFLFFTVNPKPSVSFLDIPRCCVTGKEQVVNRFQKIEGRWGYSGTPDRIKFNVDRRIFVVGFGLYGSIHGPSDYAVTIQIIHCGSGKVLATNDTSFQCDGSMNTFRVLFKEPAEISPGVTYIASACLKTRIGVDSHYGAKGVRRIVHQSSGGCCITFQFTYAAGNNNGTSVEDGQIPEIIFYTKLSS